MSGVDIDIYEITFERVAGNQQVLCTDFNHTRTESTWWYSSHYTMTDLQEYSVYTISLVAIDYYGIRSTAATRQVTTLKTGSSNTST